MAADGFGQYSQVRAGRKAIRASTLRAGIARVARWYAWLVARTTPYTRFVLGVTAAICLALLVFGADELWLSHRVAVRIQQVQSENTRLRQDTAATLRQAEWAESPAAIEAEARAMGYARPGEQSVVIVTPPPSSLPAPAPAPTSTPAPQQGDSLLARLASGDEPVWRLVTPFDMLFGG